MGEKDDLLKSKILALMVCVMREEYCCRAGTLDCGACPKEKQDDACRTFRRMVEATKKVVYPLTLTQLQGEVADWTHRNFPEPHEYKKPFMGLVEEVGELAHSLLKQEQGIRGDHDQHEIAAQDAVGDIVIYLCDLCHERGWDLQEIVEGTWSVVKRRNWQADAKRGGE